MCVQTEGIEVDEESLTHLGQIGEKTSLRHAVQLLTPSRIMGETSGRKAIHLDDVKEIDDLFLDAKASAKMLAENASRYIS